MFDDTVSENDADAIITGLGGTTVGKVPLFGIYQGEFGELTTLAALDAKIDAIEAQGISGLTAVTYDAFPDQFDDPELRSGGATEPLLSTDTSPAMENCSVMDDNMWLGKISRCPLENPEYYQLIVVMEELKKTITLNKVKIGIMDTGVNQNYGEFDDIGFVNTDAPGDIAVDTDAKMHGTKVASIIAADDDGEGINGIASKVLGNKLTLGVATNNKTTAGELAAIAQMSQNGYSVINMSYGYEKSKFQGPRYAALRAMYKSSLATLNNTLFVAAAANEAFELTRTNDFPAGLDIPNLITVGGLSRCDIAEAYSYSSYGDLIDIATAASYVPCISNKGRGYIAGSTGNSFAAPQVTAVAAILKSIKPDLTPAQLKAYLMDNALATTSGIGMRRLMYSIPVFQLLVDTNTTYQVLDLLDRYGKDNPDDPAEKDVADPSGIIVNRLCGGIQYTVKTSGGASWDGTYEIEGDETENPGALVADGAGNVLWTLGSQEDETPPTLLLSSADGSSFKIYGESYPVNDSGGAMVIFHPSEEYTPSVEPGGTLFLDNCQVLQRSGFGDFDLGGIAIPDMEEMNNEPIVIEVEGRISASVVIYTPDKKDVSITGTFVTPLAIPMAGERTALNAYIEENCICGRVAE
jgi:subtilisin family serine protease